jgi:fructose-bisphosphate aldolase class 1
VTGCEKRGIMTGVMDDRALIEKAIHDATSHLERMAASPGKRELGTRLEKMRRVVERWGKDNQPSREQVQAVLEQVAEVKRLAGDVAPTLKLRKRQSDGEA